MTIDLFSEFNQVIHGLPPLMTRYAVCGGFAVAIHGSIRATEDIDFENRKMNMTKAEKAIYKLSQVSKLAMALRQAGRESQMRVAKSSVVRESSKPWDKKRADDPQR